MRHSRSTSVASLHGEQRVAGLVRDDVGSSKRDGSQADGGVRPSADGPRAYRRSSMARSASSRSPAWGEAFFTFSLKGINHVITPSLRSPAATPSVLCSVADSGRWHFFRPSRICSDRRHEEVRERPGHGRSRAQ